MGLRGRVPLRVWAAPISFFYCLRRYSFPTQCRPRPMGALWFLIFVRLGLRSGLFRGLRLSVSVGRSRWFILVLTRDPVGRVVRFPMTRTAPRRDRNVRAMTRMGFVWKRLILLFVPSLKAAVGFLWRIFWRLRRSVMCARPCSVAAIFIARTGIVTSVIRPVLILARRRPGWGCSPRWVRRKTRTP